MSPVAEPVVLHASVALAVLRPATAGGKDAAARDALRALIEGRHPLVVPAAFWTELLDGLTDGRRVGAVMPGGATAAYAYAAGSRADAAGLDAHAAGPRADVALLAEAIHALDGMDIATVELDRPALLLVADAMERCGLGAGPASHVVLAELLDAPVATLDAAIAAAAGERALVPGAPRAPRTPSARRTPPAQRGQAAAASDAASDAAGGPGPAGEAAPDGAVTRYAALGAFLGELRRRAADAEVRSRHAIARAGSANPAAPDGGEQERP